MNSYIREILRWWELKMRLRKCKTPEERAHVRRSVSQKYRIKRTAHEKATEEIERLKAEQRKRVRMQAEAHESELRG